jgi:hypothetical protein
MNKFRYIADEKLERKKKKRKRAVKKLKRRKIFDIDIGKALEDIERRKADNLYQIGKIN